LHLHDAIGLVLASLSGVFWLALAALAWRTARALRVVGSLPPGVCASWPTVSVIIPARDEGAQVRAALEAKLADGYPALELVLVDDRSSDDTGRVARALAASDPRLTVTRVDALPVGWLGKVNALRQGVEVARGEWLLFSDADVHLAPGTLARVIAWAEAEGVDHVAALPSVTPGDRLTTLSLSSFFLFVLFARLWAVRDPRSTAAAGVGAFNLVRRRALERSPGLERLKMEIGDDQALGVMLKRSGAAQRVLVAREAVSLQFYASFEAMTRAVEKNGATAPLPVMLLGLGLLVALELGWMVWLGHPLGWAIGALAAATSWGVARWLGHPRWPAALPGLGMLPLGAVLARAALLAWRRGGVVWRGTFYPTEVVRSRPRP
jgi:cellulose synthase/poly-beta-1,6-N-acetylglucosamine synthase-like glycosyltransferase